MATRRVELGPVGQTVRAKVAAARKRRGLTLRDLAEKVQAAGRPMAHNTISEIERGARRVDVDDLVTLAKALGVSTSHLLGEVEPGLVTVEDVEGSIQQFLHSFTVKLEEPETHGDD
jgi:transcriptional regulator with XRE-family HTH domain